jgi:stringent starvation protein B
MSVDHDSQGTSTRPYLIRALHDWCIDNGFTPLLAVHVDASVRVPMEFVKNNEIVLNVSFDATSSLRLGNDVIDFKARFGGVARDIVVPIDHVIAIYARENGQGMAFPMPEGPTDLEPQSETVDLAAPGAGLRLASAPAPTAETSVDLDAGDDEPPPAAPPAGVRPSLKRIK